MTRRERVQAALSHEAPDFCPYHIQLLDAAFERVRDRYAPETFDEAVGNHLALVEPTAYSIFRTEELPGHRFRDAFGAVWVLAPGEDIGSIEDFPMKAPSLAGWSLPAPDSLIDLDPLRQEIDAAGDRFVMGGLGFSLFERAWIVRGFENVLADMAGNAGFLHALLDRVLAFNLATIDKLCELPLDGFHFGDDWGQQHGLIMGPVRWREFFKPRLAQMYARVREHGLPVSIHSCGDITEILPDLIEIGVSAISPLQGEVFDFEVLKREYGRDLSFWGGVSTQQTLPYGTPEDVIAEAKRAVRVLGRGGGYILAPSHEIQGDVPAENIQALIDFAQGLAGG